MLKPFLVVILIISIVILLLFMMNKRSREVGEGKPEIRYIALGDSYTIGEGASEDESWPVLLTKQLQKDGVKIVLIANPSITGFTTQQVIDNELPIYESLNPTFATLLIGVNDWVQGVDVNTFQQRLVIILDRMQAKLPDQSKLLLVTIPDFSSTPTGRQYSNGRDITKGITEFNDIIKEEAVKRNLQVVDIFPLTQEMSNNPDLIAPDGLHPSAKEYALWENLIYPIVYKISL